MALRDPSTYAKALGAAAGGALVWAGTAYVPDGQVDRAEWYALALVIATAVGVYQAPNATRTDETSSATLTLPVSVEPIALEIDPATEPAGK